MKKTVLCLVFTSMVLTSKTQTTWDTNLNSGSNLKLGTSSSDNLIFYSDNHEGMSLTTDGKLKINALAGAEDRILYVDANGNLKTAGPVSGGGTSLLFPNCLPSALPWYLGGNNSPADNTIGTCNYYDFVLKANNNSAIFIKPTTYVGIGLNNSSPQALVDIWDGSISSNTNHLRIYGDQAGKIESSDNMALISNNTMDLSASTDMQVAAGQNLNISANDASFASNTNLNLTSANTYFTTGQNLNISANAASLLSTTNLNFTSATTNLTSTNNMQVTVGQNMNLTANAAAFTSNTNLNFSSANTNVSSTNNMQVTTGQNLSMSANDVFAGSANNMNVVFNSANSGTPKSFNIHAGIYSPGSSEKLSVLSNGKVGIGTTNPQYKFEVFDPTSASLNVYTGSNNLASLGVANLWGRYSLTIDANFEGHITSGVKNFIGFKENSTFSYAQVWIGDARPLAPHIDYRLAVDGKLLAKSIYVTDPTTWADYVFAEDYKLPALSEVEKFYKENKHLPEIPSAKEVEERGINVAEINTLLLKKVEELTLYVVEQEKKSNEQEELIIYLTQQLAKLKQQIIR